MKIKPKNRGLFYSNFGSRYAIKSQTHPITNYGEGVMLLFEGNYYRCPVNYKAILESIYGPNYMELPPEDKRRTHYPLKVVLSDGQEFIFQKDKIKIID